MWKLKPEMKWTSYRKLHYGHVPYVFFVIMHFLIIKLWLSAAFLLTSPCEWAVTTETILTINANLWFEFLPTLLSELLFMKIIICPIRFGNGTLQLLIRSLTLSSNDSSQFQFILIATKDITILEVYSDRITSALHHITQSCFKCDAIMQPNEH